jgi:hypothetical protein
MAHTVNPSAAVLREWIDACEEHEEALTKWERDFVASVSDQLTRRGMLSREQCHTLEDIYAERTP